MIKIGCWQANVAFGDPEANADRAIELLRSPKAVDLDLLILPECFLTGYCVNTHELARQIAIPGNHPSLGRLASAATETGKHLIVGYAEDCGDQLVNTATILTPTGERHTYRKVHLPELGYDKFVTGGDELPVFDTAIGRIGVLICFDVRFPEAARHMALAGAELLVIPTNWPEGSQNNARVLAPARAAENRVFVASCNRVGEENTFSFVGLSGIFDVRGSTIVMAGGEEELITATLDLAEARTKRTVIRPGEHETTVFESRRPELYRDLVKPIETTK